MTWRMLDALGTTLSVIIVVGILALAGMGALVVYSLITITSRVAQWEEDHLGERRS